MVYRIQELVKNDDPRIPYTIVDEGKPVFLSGFNKIDKNQGLYKLGKKDISKLWSGPYTYRMLSADDKINKVIYTKEDYQNSPDLYLLADFKNETKLTDINPQQEDYNWGTAELVHWTTPKGYKSEGILYKPEDFDPNKKYPIIAYFYETLSDGLYTYQAPAPTPSRLNIPYFVSNGYLVFAPDIRYETGYPGKSAEEFINSGMHYLARNNNWVDSTKMGIQGQSWGGYQVAHLITRTDMYAAAWSGAPVVNMTSAYGGIRWGTGMSRQFQYENTQSRIGKPLWEARDLYIENSPLFFMDKVNTPVAIMHNDNDGAVPWYQGIEFFTALRRLNKPVWLLNYNGDDHNLIQRQNRKDIQIREAQFFDHFLKGKPAANWIKKGVKATEKGIDWGLEVD
jgi:dipeptidyl aminopeptidase/acylaminoacyl peptidase